MVLLLYVMNWKRVQLSRRHIYTEGDETKSWVAEANRVAESGLIITIVCFWCMLR